MHALTPHGLPFLSACKVQKGGQMGLLINTKILRVCCSSTCAWARRLARRAAIWAPCRRYEQPRTLPTFAHDVVPSRGRKCAQVTFTCTGWLPLSSRHREMRFFVVVVVLQAVAGRSSEPTVPCRSTAFSPLEFGAKFDGMSDDTQAWMRTIAAALNCSLGVAVVVPAGRSLLSATLQISLTGNQALQ